jgi:two-component system, LytTR family, sensor kinase
MMKVYKVPEFEFNTGNAKKFRKKEIIIRFLGISFISIFSTLNEFNVNPWSHLFWELLVVNSIAIAVIWHSSMFIIQYTVSKISVFKQPIKLLTYLITFLSVMVIGVMLSTYYIEACFFNYRVPLKVIKIVVTIAWLITFLISCIYAAVGFFIQWKENLFKAQKLEKANLEAQYETLKNQVNPHFLFNSLNTLLTMVQDNPQASKYVESVSEFMRYVLQFRSKEAVLLRDELRIAREYAYIQKSRFGDKLMVNFDIPEYYYHYAIPPLTLQMLIENAIKHNVISKDDPLQVKIYVGTPKMLIVENPLKIKQDKEPSTGLGLINISKRYQYLTGKDIKVDSDNGVFKVFLPLFEMEL